MKKYFVQEILSENKSHSTIFSEIWGQETKLCTRNFKIQNPIATFQINVCNMRDEGSKQESDFF
jgi:hypothetical protein